MYSHDTCEQPHGTSAQGRSCFSTGQARPPCSGTTRICRVRCCLPSPPPCTLQVREHVVHLPHAVTAQSRGHASVLHGVYSSSAAHEPPCAAGAFMVRWRRLCPPPHVRVQSLHAPNSESSQFTGHGCSLHARESRKLGHWKPPCAKWRVIVRTRCCCAPPQDTEHVLQRDHALTSQCTGQGPSSHSRVSANAPHTTPPNAVARVMLRARWCTPAAHVVLHAPQSAHSDVTQSTGHLCALQPRS